MTILMHLLLMVALTGCGQKGPLFLPPDKPAVEPASDDSTAGRANVGETAVAKSTVDQGTLNKRSGALATGRSS